MTAPAGGIPAGARCFSCRSARFPRWMPSSGAEIAKEFAAGLSRAVGRSRLVRRGGEDRMLDRLDPAVVLLVATLLPAPVTALAGLRRPAWAAPVAIGSTVLAFLAALWGWSGDGGAVDVAWAPTWDLRLAFTLDGLAVLYALLATGVGLAVVVYSARYLPLHLEHQHRP